VKSNLPPSKNVEDRSSDTSSYAPHRNPAENKIANESRAKEVAALARKGREDVKDWGKKNPAYDALKAMDDWESKPEKDANVPIPTERPDPNAPYVKPTVMLPRDDKGGMLRPGSGKEKQKNDKINGGMKPKPRA
jgi:hypothetical protein